MRSIRSLLEAQLGRLLWDENTAVAGHGDAAPHHTQLGLTPMSPGCWPRDDRHHPVGG
jgi:hypothetical protein